MVERPTRTSNGAEPRGDDLPEWEVFVRSDREDPLRHVGSVAAPTPEAAHEHAGRLFAWYASDVWICPANAVHRFSERDLGSSAADEAGDADGSDGADGSADHDAQPDVGDERRVREW